MQMTSRAAYLFLKIQAVLLLVVGQRRRALPCFDLMLQLRPQDRYALASRAHVQAQDKNLVAAIMTLQQLTAAWPQDAAAWFNLGYVLQQAGRHEDAEPAFRSALAQDPRMDRAWYGLALALIERQQFHAAVDALEKNTALQPMSPYGWYRLALVRLELGQPEEALKLIAHLRQFEPQVAAQLERETGLAQTVTASGVCHATH